MFESLSVMKQPMFPQYALAHNVPNELLKLKFFLCQHFTNDTENIHMLNFSLTYFCLKASAHCGDLYVSMHVLVDALDNGLHLLLYYQMHKFSTKILHSTRLHQQMPSISICSTFSLSSFRLKAGAHNGALQCLLLGSGQYFGTHLLEVKVMFCSKDYLLF